MTDIFGILNIGKNALETQQMAINVTGQNIANVNTPGYTRQRVNMVSTSSTSIQGMPIGTGVKATEVQRIYDGFVDRQLNIENQKLGTWEGMQGSLELVEITFNEASGYGLGEAMDGFWNAWQDLAMNPSGYVERISLLSKSNTLSMTITQTFSNLEKIQESISNNISSSLDEVNILAGEIRDLNQQIVQTEVNGHQANDLRDQRGLLVRELSTMIDVETAEDEQGKINIFVGGGHPLVSGIDAWELSTAPNPDPSLEDIIVWKSHDGSSVDITENILNGKVKGMIDARDDYIPDYLDRLNQLAKNMINDINAIHSSGDDLNGNDGGLFFEIPDAVNPAKFMQVAINDPNLIAGAADGGGVGDNSNTLSIVELQNGFQMGGSATYDEFYQTLVSDVGNIVKYVGTNESYQTSMVEYLENYRESISGVSTDEEMVNLVKFQHAYEAAARLINTIDEMLDSLLSLA